MGEEVDRTEPDVTFEFGHDDEAPLGARRALRPLFPERGRLADDVGLVASEFVSNVIRHTEDGGRLKAWDEDPLRLEVTDTDPALPSPAGYADERGGHGLRIVTELADDWGAAPVEGNGKTVWAEFQRHSRRATPLAANANEPVVDDSETDEPGDDEAR